MTHVALVAHGVLHREHSCPGVLLQIFAITTLWQLTSSHDKIKKPLSTGANRHIYRTQTGRGNLANQDPARRAPSKLEESNSFVRFAEAPSPEM